MAETDGEGRDEERTIRYRERLAATLTAVGLPRMPARVWAALFVADSGRLTAAEVAETLKVSPAAVSGAIRYLQQVKMAFREREPGNRRDHYVVRDDMWQAAITGRDQMLLQLQDTLREGIPVLGADTPAGARITESVDFMDFLMAEMQEMLKRWQEHRATR
ncbi:GbsR/MarR family transcriptional regulator [Actinocatenispora rupis]|uniref:Transcriptional regulator n=1 Tax=Actinocatenispora rupis TaxID=519421 RepID=A0A8J3J6Y9_9ACTN|nr:MarR family transcriptional regulator [Actinocatenispora rupis]GID13165.1 transcriptional regulator [Actinocatenispora rupis]